MTRNTDYFDSEQFEQDLLNAYFHFRCNLPMKDADTRSRLQEEFQDHPGHRHGT